MLRIADEITADQLDPAARAELRTLPSDLADSVARHLVASGLQEDPGQAYLYAKQARKLAARVGVVREACGIAAYRAGEWAEALAELRAARRLTGRDSGVPLMADSERALGRLDRALAIVQEPQNRSLDRATQIELTIVESGIRRDQGMADAALLALQVPELSDGRTYPWSARLFYAYADTLLEAGRRDEARDWFARAAAADADEETDAAERFEDLDDVIIEDLGEEEADPEEEEEAGLADVAEADAGPDQLPEADVASEQLPEADAGPDQPAEADAGLEQLPEADAGPDQPAEADASPQQLAQPGPDPDAGPDQPAGAHLTPDDPAGGLP